ncbi:hypothetical protein ACFY0G_17545 [Streptomyces sp. NPDC001552]|uniref:hypothetical protein n=1 Tax=Streptomyces sp. NPDC001552 TaxID=3364587 RepID=UPI00369AE85C
MSRTGPRNAHADYEPGKPMLDAIEAWEKAVAEEERLRHAARKAVADELREAGVSHGALSNHVPWTEGTVKNIAKEYGVPGLRQRKPEAPAES